MTDDKAISSDEPQHAPQARSPLAPVGLLASIGSLCLSVALAIGLWLASTDGAGPLAWGADLIASGGVQVCLGALALSVGGLAVRGTRRLGVVSLSIAAALGALMVGTSPGRTPAAGASEVSLLIWNGNAENRDVSSLVSAVDRDPPDVGVLCEISPEHVRAIRQDAVLDMHPFVEALPPAPGRSSWVLVVSTHPLDRIERDGVLAVRVNAPGRAFTLIGLHATSPRTAERWSAGNSLVRNAIESAGAIGGPVIIAGDLNATRWGRRGRDLADAGFAPAKPVSRASGSYPRLVWPATLSIDDAWLGEGVTAAAWDTSEPMGSDHRSVRVGLAFE